MAQKVEKRELRSEAALIRPWRPEDAPLLFEAASSSMAEMFPWMPWCHPQYAPEESESFVAESINGWAEGTKYQFAVFDPHSGVLAGGVGINQFNEMHRFANLGYWVRTDRRQRGVATAATLLAAQFAFAELKLTRLEIVTAVGNIASQRVAERAGARREGLLRNRLVLHDQAHDAVMYSLIPSGEDSRRPEPTGDPCWNPSHK